MAIRITTQALFTSGNPTLASGDYGIESDTGHYKLGDGATVWNSLTYSSITNDFIRSLVNDINTIGSSIGSKVASKSADYTMVYTDGTILVTTAGTDRIITLPVGQTTSYVFNGATYYRIYSIKKVDSGVGKIVLTPVAPSLIDGGATLDITSQDDSVIVQYDGTDYNVLGNITSGGGSAWGSITGTLSTQSDLQSALDAKQDDLVSATNIKTINGSSILGAGDLVVSSALPDLIITKYAPATDQTITAGYSAYYSGYYEIADTKYLEIGEGSTLEIG